MKTFARILLVVMLSLTASSAALAQYRGGGFHGGYHGGYAHGWHGYGGWHGGWRGGGWGWGLWPLGFFAATLPLGYATYWYGNSPYYYADGSYWAAAPGGYTVVAPPAQIVAQAPAAPVAAPAAAPAPIFYPRNGQSAQRTESDRRACNTWATTQQSAMSDGSVFQRAVMACMEGRGYTAK